MCVTFQTGVLCAREGVVKLNKKHLKAPFVYFGGKSTVSNKIWQHLGDDVAHYIEPFFGSGAVLLGRPGWKPGMCETINDADGFVSNVWRALQYNPDEVARWCDWPVNHADLSARKAALLKNESRLLENLVADDTWYDAKMAGYWIWAASCWIGTGLTKAGQIPYVADGGSGVHAIGKIPYVADGGKGVHAIGQIPHVIHGGKGVHAIGQIPHVADNCKDVRSPYNTNLYEWFRTLSERLRYVRVVCGDWTSVCGGDWQDNMGICGMFFDPPYSADAGRGQYIYHKESTTVAHDVSEWAVKRGSRKTYRIVIAGYEGEHEWLLEYGWRKEAWSASGGYGNQGDGKGKENRHKEALFVSPHCVGQRRLF